MNLFASVLHCPRPAGSPLADTLRALAAAGWPEPLLVDGSPPLGARSSPIGCTQGYMRMFRAVLDRPGIEQYDGLLAVEDDVVLNRNVRAYLDRLPWPGNPARVGLCSVYCPEAYSNHNRPFGVCGRWHREIRGPSLAGSQAWIYPLPRLPDLLAFLAAATKGIDVEVGQWTHERDLDVWYHTPSLAQHVGIGNSAVGYPDLGTIYRATTYEADFDPLDLLNP